MADVIEIMHFTFICMNIVHIYVVDIKITGFENYKTNKKPPPNICSTAASVAH